MARLIARNDGESTEFAWIETIWQQPVQRVFWIYSVPESSSRGGHHHQTCRMALHCITGSVDIYVQTPTTDHYFTLDSPTQYLFLDAEDWRLMHRFSSDAVLMIFASKPFEQTLYFDQPYRPVNLTPRTQTASKKPRTGRIQ